MFFIKRNLSVLSVFCLLSMSCAFAQYNISLSEVQKQQQLEIGLHDEYGGNKLLDLSLTFQITDKNVLIMLVGDGNRLPDNKTVCLFTERNKISDLQRVSPNILISKNFKNRYSAVLPFFESNKMKLYKEFDDKCEIIKKNPKPIFFYLLDQEKLPQTINLQLYVAAEDDKNYQMLISKCVPVTIKINFD